jgi:hexosaminidase
LIPVSHTLSEVAAIGLRALDDLENHRAADTAMAQNNVQMLEAAAKPEAVLIDMVAPSVELLVKATSTK